MATLDGHGGYSRQDDRAKSRARRARYDADPTQSGSRIPRVISDPSRQPNGAHSTGTARTPDVRLKRRPFAEGTESGCTKLACVMMWRNLTGKSSELVERVSQSDDPSSLKGGGRGA